MSNGLRKRMKTIEAVITGCGFKCVDMTITRADHICCHIIDDEGNKFRAWTGQSCSANVKKARLNFRQDIRRMSNKAKGLIS